MINIFFPGKGQKQSIGARLLPALGKVLDVAYLGASQYVQQGNSPRLLLIDKPCARICCPKGLVLMEQESPGQISLNGDFICVLWSGHQPALEFAQKHKIKTVTCGLSPYDTLTLSSITAELAVVTLQREICTLGGTTIEPADFPVALSQPWEAEAILAAAAILLLSDCGDQLQKLVL